MQTRHSNKSKKSRPNTEEKRWVTLWMERRWVAKIDALAKSRGLSRSGVIECMIQAGADEEEAIARVLAEPVSRKAMLDLVATPQFMETVLGGKMPHVSPERLKWIAGALAASESVLKDMPPAPRQPTLFDGALAEHRTAGTPAGGAQAGDTRQRQDGTSSPVVAAEPAGPAQSATLRAKALAGVRP